MNIMPITLGQTVRVMRNQPGFTATRGDRGFVHAISEGDAPPGTQRYYVIGLKVPGRPRAASGRWYAAAELALDSSPDVRRAKVEFDWQVLACRKARSAAEEQEALFVESLAIAFKLTGAAVRAIVEAMAARSVGEDPREILARVQARLGRRHVKTLSLRQTA